MDAPVRLTLLGGVDLAGAPGAAELLAQSKLVALLAYLALGARTGHPRRDRIVALLWPDLDESHARAALRKELHALRRLLGEGVIETRGDEDVGLSADAFWCDAVAFACAEAEGRLDEALDLYRGELMPGFHVAGCADYEQWLEEERGAARDRAGATAWALAIRHEHDRSLTAAGMMARRAVRLLAGNERVLRRSLELLDRIGDRAGAVMLYDEFAKRLRAELDMEPSPETQALAGRLRAGGPS